MELNVTEIVKWVIGGLVLLVATYRIAVPILKALGDGKIKKLSASKEGGVSLEMSEVKRVKQNSTDRYHRDQRIADEDHRLAYALRQATFKQRSFILREIDRDSLCGNSLWALASNFLNQLLEAVFENNFKHNLAAARIEEYRAEKVAAIHDEYEDFLGLTRGQPCDNLENPSRYPSWEEVKPVAEGLVRHWTLALAPLVVEACRRKIEIYNEFIDKYSKPDEEDLDELKIMQDCSAKNAGYIDGILGNKGKAE